MKRVIRIKEISHKTGRSRSSIYRNPELRALLFRIGEHSVGALESDVDNLIERQAAKGAAVSEE
jgi:predicted DNA-binding transcriptional regulator AlpA